MRLLRRLHYDDPLPGVPHKATDPIVTSIAAAHAEHVNA